MKNTFFMLLPLTAMVIAGCRPDKIVSGEATLQVTDDMAWTLTFPQGSVILSDNLVTDGGVLGSFGLESVSSERTDRGMLLRVEGETDGIVKRQQVEVRDSLENLFIFRTSYVNGTGFPVTVTSWEGSNFSLDADLVYSFQPTSSSRRADWVLPVEPGFYQRNYLGMNDSDYGGGIPMVDLWTPEYGVAVGLDEKVLRLAAMPVERPVGSDVTTVGIRFEYTEPVTIAPGESLETFSTFVTTHTGDYFNALRTFSDMMVSEGFSFAPSEPEAFEPVWCAWGYERTFTPDEVIGTLPKVKELGFKWVDVDDGFQIAEGDWNTRKGFKGGDKAMRRITDEIHRLGMKAKLWYAPLAADPGTRLLKDTPEVLLEQKDGTPEYITWWDSWYLSPVNPYTRKHTSDMIDMFMKDWGFDGLKLDGQHLNLCMPDYNPASGLSYPEEAVERMPEFFKDIYDRAKGIRENAVVQLCPCGCAMNFYHLPYFNQAVASDPESSWQVRLKGKAYKAMNNDLAYYADHVELTDTGLDFESQFGIGGVLGSKFTWPKPNPDVKSGGYLLTPEKEALLKKWIALYNEKMLSRGRYLNLYDIAFDLPEAHVIVKDGNMYYAFYAEEWDGMPIELRGLEKGRDYVVCEYTTDGKRTYSVNGSDPWISPRFKGSYLIEVY